MAKLSDRSRAIYLIFLILFLLGMGFFIFDYFQILKIETVFPFLEKKASLINQDLESPTELEKLEFQKSIEQLEEEKQELLKKKAELEKEKEKFALEQERIREMERSIRAKEEEIQSQKQEEMARGKQVKIIAQKIANMPPASAAQMLENWPDRDIIDVFIQMDKDAEEAGTSTITTYLLTLLPSERRAMITNKWLSRENLEEVKNE